MERPHRGDVRGEDPAGRHGERDLTSTRKPFRCQFHRRDELPDRRGRGRLPAAGHGRADRGAGPARGRQMPPSACAPSKCGWGGPRTAGCRPRVAALVYFGTDTHCHLHLADSTEVVARLQNPSTGEAGLTQGSRSAAVRRRRRAAGGGPEMSPAEDRVIKASARNGWLQSMPALVLLTVAAVGRWSSW